MTWEIKSGLMGKRTSLSSIPTLAFSYHHCTKPKPKTAGVPEKPQVTDETMEYSDHLLHYPVIAPLLARVN